MINATAVRALVEGIASLDVLYDLALSLLQAAPGNEQVEHIVAAMLDELDRAQSVLALEEDAG